MELLAYLDKHYLPERPGLSSAYNALLRSTVSQLVEFFGQPIEIAELDRSLLTAWANRCLQTGLKPGTVNNRLRMVRTLLLAAYDDGLLDVPPRRVKRLREPHLPPRAWTIDQCRTLLEALAHQPGRIGDVLAGDWWFSLAYTVYWTGARIGAVLAVDAADYEPGVGIVLRKQKNGQPLWLALPVVCCTAVEKVLPPAGLIWRWPWHRNLIWIRFRTIVESVGLPCPREHGQLFYRLRRTNLSYCAAEDPALAQRQADHSDVRITMRHYVDPRIARQRSAVDVLPDPMQPGETFGGLRVVH